ncbi:MAG: histidine kinase [Roseiflexaceae bacterium]|nr:histidine kinase [Roseiflexaceae bacterium]
MARHSSPVTHRSSWRRHFAIFWDAFLTVAIGAGLFDAAQRVGLWNARGLWMLLLALAFLIAHRWLWAPVRHASGEWPPLYRDLLIVLVVEFVLVLALLPASAWFALLFLAMLGQIAAAAPIRRWWLPFAAILLTLAGPIGLYDALATQRWGAAAGLAAVIAWLPVLFLYIRLFFDEREERAALERDLHAAHAEIERVTPLLRRLEALQSREQALADTRDGMHHTLAYLNLQLDTARQQLRDDPATAGATLAALHELVQQRLKEIAPGSDESAGSASSKPDQPAAPSGDTQETPT